MERDMALRTLRDHKSRLQTRYGITRLGIFGSVARGQAEASSDVDVVVEMPPDLFKMVHLKDELEALLEVPVDLIRYHSHLNAYLKGHIDHEAIFI